MKLKIILESVNSKRDRNGNCYWYFNYTDNETGKTISGTVSGGDSNIRSIVRELNLNWDEVHYFNTQMSIREFNKIYNNLPYAGCTAKELVSFIKKELEK